MEVCYLEKTVSSDGRNAGAVRGDKVARAGAKTRSCRRFAKRICPGVSGTVSARRKKRSHLVVCGEVVMATKKGEERWRGYRCEATSVSGFIQQLAVGYVARGYLFYVARWIPEKKEPRAIDEKLVKLYGIDASASERSRRKKAGTANVQYLRHGRFFVLLATHGKGFFFEDQAATFQDVREVSIKYAGYSVSYRGGHPSVRIAAGEYKRLKAYFAERAVHRPEEWLRRELSKLPFEPYAPIRRQLLAILREVNRARKQAGLAPLAGKPFRFQRRIYKPFAPPDVIEETAVASVA
jgi:hypothetical protein